MKCPKCSSTTRVLTTRTPVAGIIRRRHKCTACGLRFGTIQTVIADYARDEGHDVNKWRNER